MKNENKETVAPNVKPTLEQLKSFAYDKIAIIEQANKELAEANKMIASYQVANTTNTPSERRST